jgi:CelD/BcsL family acetyltransferase involved in cellulose biosynthesis
MAPVPTDPMLLAMGDRRWTSFVAQHPEATPFHHPAWMELLARTYGYPGFVIATAGQGGRIAAGAPFLEVRTVSRRRRWISLPFTDECPLLASGTGSRQQLIDALGAARQRFGAPGLQVRGPVDGLGWSTGADAVIHELDLTPGLERVRERFSRSQVIRSIARAEREGVVVRRGRGASDLEAFYRLHTSTRRRQGIPVQPRRFFELLWSRLVEPGLAFMLLADTAAEETVAGALFLAGGGTTIYKFGASEPRSWPLRPNHLIFWSAIRDACGRGDRRFDFGRTDLDNGGLRAFKSTWGAAERPLRYSTLAAAGATPGLARRALSTAIRRGPDWICRGAGAALYRYAASR